VVSARAAAVVAVLAASLAGCGAGSVAAPAKHVAPSAAHPVAKRVCRAGVESPLGSRRRAYAAIAKGPLLAFRKPGGAALARFERQNVNGLDNVFGVVGVVKARSCKAVWYHVQLPMRPNGAMGWIRASAVWIGRVGTRIEIDVSARRLVFFRDGLPVLQATVAVGAPATPTPTGRYYVNQRLIPIDKSGPFGPGAIGISAFSNVLTGWTQGGPVAIHGTNEPWSIGHSVSNGCIRLPNAVLRRLFYAVTAGTPVIIRA
jgi:lipoprotein-anchoring transpeptidase ErfK/SrfK